MSSPQTPFQSPFSIIAAVHTPTGGIGIKGRLPWHIPADLAFFAETTQGAVVIMGRRTWESLPSRCRPLRGRINLVLTRCADPAAAGATTAPSLEAALQLAADKWPSHPIFVIGGEQVYREAIVHPACTALHITKVMRLPSSPVSNAAPPLSFDAFFPKLPGLFDAAGADADADAPPQPRFICTEKKATCQYANWLYCFTRYKRAPPAPAPITPEV